MGSTGAEEFQVLARKSMCCGQMGFPAVAFIRRAGPSGYRLLRSCIEREQVADQAQSL